MPDERDMRRWAAEAQAIAANAPRSEAAAKLRDAATRLLQAAGDLAAREDALTSSEVHPSH